MRFNQVATPASSNCNEVLSGPPGFSTPRFSPSGHGWRVDTIVLESCHSTWIFDNERKQFCRILKGVEVANRPVTTEWRPYWSLHLEPQIEAFTIYLNAAHTRQIRSWRHTQDCAQCGGHETAELSIDDIRRVVHL
jgi:hypothetical protein